MPTTPLAIISYIIVGLIVLLFLAKRFQKPEVCAICGMQAEDSYSVESGALTGKSTSYCRNHLVETWRKGVLASTPKMVVIEPDFNAYPYGYLYASKFILEEWQYGKKSVARFLEIISGIAGKSCASCGAPATVAFYTKDQYDFPKMENLPEPKSHLCKKCMADKVAPLIANAAKPLIEGLYAPTKEEGIYHVQEF